MIRNVESAGCLSSEYMLARQFVVLMPILGVLLQGCCTFQSEVKVPAADKRVDFADPVLNRRQVLLFGSIDQQAAEHTIQKLLFLEGISHDPIDLYLQTPGGEFKHAMAIEQVMRRLQSPETPMRCRNAIPEGPCCWLRARASEGHFREPWSSFMA
jgi:hypothetical protein